MSTSTVADKPPVRQRRKQHERREEAERRILDSAIALISEKGIAGMTLGEVGERAGYSRGLPAHHYGNKEGLLIAVVESIGASFRDARRSGGRKSPGMQSIVDIVRVYLDRSAGHDLTTRALHVMFSEGFVSGGPLAAALDRFNRLSLAHIEAHIRIGIRRGEIRSEADPAAESVVILGALRGISAQFLVGLSNLSGSAVRDALVDTITRGLRP
jgi:AcrR family transcriptional regulator